MEHFDILIIGAGAAGIAAAKGAWSAGCRSIAMVDRKASMGGVLLQCAHSGFGAFQTGPEYTRKLLTDVPEAIRFYSNTTVLKILTERVAILSGGRRIGFRQLILATGCREIPLGALRVAGTRPQGVYTAGQMQEMMNLHGFVPEGPVVILGSGDLGLIMANQIARLGCDVTILEKRDICGGMARNQKCLQNQSIRLLCSTTIAEVCGERILTAVITTEGTVIPCKTLLVAVGLRPDREVVFGLENEPWLSICGNCKMVHPMVESVVSEGKQTGITAWENIRGSL